MIRLREEVDSPDTIVANAARMVMDLAPLAESGVRRGRVLRTINRKKQVTAPRISGPFLAAMVVMGAAATASAALGVSGRLTSRKANSLQTSPVPQASNAPQAMLPSRIAPTPAPPSAPHIEPSLGVESTAINGEENSDVKETWLPRVNAPGTAKHPLPPKQSRKEAASSTAKPEIAALSPISQAALVQRAVEALRQSNNPAKAAALLKEYRQKAPSGALAEEALALSIEVAIAQGSAQAQVYAAQYSNLYPSGRFRDLAHSALR